MTSSPCLVLLHGINYRPPAEHWLEALNEGLRQYGARPYAREQVVAPNLSDALRRPKSDIEVPVTWVAPSAEATAAYRERQRACSELLAPLSSGKPPWWSPGWRAMDTLAHAAIDLPLRLPLLEDLSEAAAFRNNAYVRHAVLSEITALLPRDGKVILVGFSLGSSFALHLMRRLPPGVHVAALITLASPCGMSHFGDEDLRAVGLPYDRVDNWINIYDPSDHVIGFSGVSHRFPDALDVPVPHCRHDLGPLLRTPAMAAAIEWAQQP